MNDGEKKLLKKLRSYRSAMTGSVFLAVMTVLALLGTVGFRAEADPQLLTVMYTQAFFWPMLAYICHLKIKLLRLELHEFEKQHLDGTSKPGMDDG